MQYDVFISFKNSGKNGKQTPDAGASRKVYEALKERGINAFFSEESLADKGSGQFSKAIEAALDSARVLVLVASCRDHIESRWVEAEWDSFLQDVRSGHKEGELFILNCGDLKPTDLPLFLRRQQMFKESDLDKMLSFISSAMVPEATLNELIELSLHCHRPEKNEDKVYLLTVQQGSSAATRNVKAHWGARSSKRLNSQVKAVDVSADDAAKEVEKALQEKLRGGYLPVSHVDLLTSEAWSILAASLSVSDAPPREKPVKAGAKTKPAKVLTNNTPKKPVESPKKASTVRAKSTARIGTGPKTASTMSTSSGVDLVDEPKSKKPAKSSMTPSSSKVGKPAPSEKPRSEKANKKRDSASEDPVPLTLIKKTIKDPSLRTKSVHKSAAPKAEGGALASPPVSKPSGTVCISGKLPSGSKKADYAKSLQNIGLELVDDVTKGLSYLVVADPGAVTSKSAKAQKLGVPILSEDQLKALIAKSGKPVRAKKSADQIIN